MDEFLYENIKNTTGKILDYGCGEGRFIKLCSDRGLKILGADTYDGIYNSWKTDKQNIVSIYNNLTPFPNSEFQVILSNQTFEHIQQTKIENFNRELKLKQDEFTDIIQKKVPPTPVFADDTDGYNSKLTFEQLVEDRKNNIMPLNLTLPTLRKSVVVNEDEMTDEINVIDLNKRYNKTNEPVRKKITWDDTNMEQSDNILGFFKKKMQVDEVVQKEDKYLDVIAELKKANNALNEKVDRLLVMVEEIKSRTCV